MVDEEFPGISIPSDDELEKMSEVELEEIREETLSKSAEMPDKTIEEMMPVIRQVTQESEPQPKSLTRATFKDADSFHKGSGTATAYELPDGKKYFVLKISPLQTDQTSV
ncbi:MAG: hypothetical protein QF858_03180 [Candidatus Pacebacteria bacterium]|nr:hypothetical protein [Candidatus Paceibacterota bacterium]